MQSTTLSSLQQRQEGRGFFHAWLLPPMSMRNARDCSPGTGVFRLASDGFLEEGFSLANVFREVENSVTAPRGFRAGGTACGIKSDASIKDLALLIADVPCVAAGT